jgi:hypothetical protein
VAGGAAGVSYLWIKWLHILGASVLFGTGLGPRLVRLRGVMGLFGLMLTRGSFR